MNRLNSYMIALSALGCFAPNAFAQIGACCLNNGGCITTNEAGCQKVSGEYIGDGASCDNAVCEGACCRDNLVCSIGTNDDCTSVGGTYQGAGSQCTLDCPTKLGSAFLYQGRLAFDGAPITDSADFIFTLWTTANGGDQISEFTANDVEVVDGLFHVELDFGTAALDGTTRWMEIEVRSPHDPDDTVEYEVLTPRQYLAPTPYAVQTRGIQVNDVGSVAVGGTPTGVPLSVYGSMHTRTEEGFGLRINPADDNAVLTWTTNSGAWSVVRINPVGLGVYRKPTTHALEVNGSASKNTAGSWVAHSDARIKTDVQTITNAVEVLSRVNPVSFRYNESHLRANPSIDDRRYLNVIAQEFAKVFPDWVYASNDKTEDGSDLLQVDTYPITIYAAAAIRELNAKLVEKDEQIAQQAKRIDSLETMLLDRIQAIERRLGDN